MDKRFYRGDIYYANLRPGLGAEQTGRRPVIIVQNNTGNTNAPTLIVVPITSQAKASLPTHLLLQGVTGVIDDSIALVEQICTIDKSRVGKYLGFLGATDLQLLDLAMARGLGLELKGQDKPLLMTLCHSCAKGYWDRPEYRVKRVDSNRLDKEPCTKCSTGRGFDYWLSRK
jgi:mRNA interferase MazF